MSPKPKDCRLGRAPKEKDKPNGEIKSEGLTDVASSSNDKVRQRDDRSKKLLERRDLDMTVVKAAIRKYINGDEETKDRVLRAIDDREVNYSIRMVEGSYALMGLLKDLFHGVEDLLAVQVDDIFSQTFVRQLLLGPGGAENPNDLIGEYYTRHPELTPIARRNYSDGNIYSAGATTYLTNLKNSFKMNIGSRIKTFCRRFKEVHNLNNAEYVWMLYQINGWTNFPQQLLQGGGQIFPLRQEVVDTIAEHRRVLGLIGNARLTKGWTRLSTSLPSMLRYNILINRFYEAHDNIKIFNIVPICKIRAHFMTIDTDALFGILKDAKLIAKDLKYETFYEMRHDHWHATFKISKLQGKDNVFGENIQTDGVSMCMHFQRPSRPPISTMHDGKKAYQLDTEKDVVFGLDPGRINIFYLATILGDGKALAFLLSRRQYYHDSGIFKAVQQSNKWNETVKEALEDLSRASPKAVFWPLTFFISNRFGASISRRNGLVSVFRSTEAKRGHLQSFSTRSRPRPRSGSPIVTRSSSPTGPPSSPQEERTSCQCRRVGRIKNALPDSLRSSLQSSVLPRFRTRMIRCFS